MLLKCILEVLFGVDACAVFVLEPKRKVSDHPEEGREVFAHLVGVSILSFLATYLKLLGQVDDQRQVLESILVYGSHRVIDEIRAKK